MYGRKLMLSINSTSLWQILILGLISKVERCIKRIQNCQQNYGKFLADFWKLICAWFFVPGKAGLDMEMRICASGLKVVTKDQGLTEYRAHRITYSVCPKINPRMFVWVYRHDGKKLKVSSLAIVHALDQADISVLELAKPV
jgi:hypothetical protein